LSAPYKGGWVAAIVKKENVNENVEKKLPSGKDSRDRIFAGNCGGGGGP
jgi:hypothetical protein